MFRLAAALALPFSGSCLRMDQFAQQQQLVMEPRPEKKVFGPEHRSCRRGTKDRADHAQSVIGGTVVHDPDEFPFLAWLGDNDGTKLGQFCGGTLITDRIVLTAGHCLYSSDYNNAKLWVRMKLADFAEMDGVARNVINWRQHPEYSTMTLHNDLTLLLLNESVPESLVKPVKLSDGTQDFEHQGDKMVVGWGSTDEACMVYDTLLRKADVPFGSDGPECASEGSKTITPKDDYDVNSQCCAGDYRKDMHYPGCGDSGGPLLAKEGDSWTQVGMVSWSYGIPYPDVFTRVSYFKDWIDQTIEELMAAGENEAIKVYGPGAQSAYAQ